MIDCIQGTMESWVKRVTFAKAEHLVGCDQVTVERWLSEVCQRKLLYSLRHAILVISNILKTTMIRYSVASNTSR